MIRKLLTVAAIILITTSCEEKAVVDPKDVLLDKLRGTWVYTHVTLDGVARTDYADFKLLISDSFTYTTSGNPNNSPWPANGTFTFKDTHPEFDLLRDDNVGVTYTMTDTSLEMTFTYSTPDVRSNGFDPGGIWVFTLRKQ